MAERMEDFRDIADALGCGLLVFDTALKVVHANSQAAALLRLSFEELIGQSLETLDGRLTDRFDTPFLLAHCTQKRTPIGQQQAQFHQPDGSTIPLSVKAAPLLGVAGRLKGAVVGFTPRSRSEERLHQFIGAMDEVVFEFDSDGRYLHVWSENPQLLKIPPQKLLGKLVEEVVPATLAAQLRGVMQRVKATGRPESFEYPLDVLKGRRWFLARVALVAPLEGEAPTFSFLARDITPMKTLEQQLQESQQRFRGVFDQSFQFCGLLHPDGTLLEINKTAREFFSVGKDAVVGRPFWETPGWIQSPAQQEALRAAIREAAQGRCVRFESIHHDPQGKEHFFDVSVKPVRDEAGHVILLIPEGRDITEHKRAVKALREANRDLETFVHTVSHDLRTPLTAILGYAQFLRTTHQNQLDDQGLEMLAEIEKNGERMKMLMADLLALAQVGNLDNPPQPVDTNRMVKDAIMGLADCIYRNGAEVQVSDLPPLRVPETLLLQIFDNLIGNAVRYAGSTGSPIEIGGERQGEKVRLYVRDHGPGIPAAERERIFELFYRGATGRHTVGTGVGLTTVQNIARKRGGDAWVEETPGGGATFWLELLDPSPT